MRSVELVPSFASSSSVAHHYDSQSGQIWHRPSGVNCSGTHCVGGCRSQLNPCVFFLLLFWYERGKPQCSL